MRMPVSPKKWPASIGCERIRLGLLGENGADRHGPFSAELILSKDPAEGWVARSADAPDIGSAIHQWLRAVSAGRGDSGLIAAEASFLAAAIGESQDSLQSGYPSGPFNREALGAVRGSGAIGAFTENERDYRWIAVGLSAVPFLGLIFTARQRIRGAVAGHACPTYEKDPSKLWPPCDGSPIPEPPYSPW